MMPCLLLTPLSISLMGGLAAVPLPRADRVGIKSPSLPLITLWATSSLRSVIYEVLDPLS